MLSRLTLIALLSAATLCAQTQQPTRQPAQLKPIASQPVEDLVDQLVANASVYRANLPSLIVDEDIVSDLTILGIYTKHAEAHATFRAIRKSDDSSLDESREITILNGKPVRPGDHPLLPVVLFGGFGRFQDMFFSPQHRPCFNFVLEPPNLRAPLQIDITLKPTAATIPGCEHGLTGLTGIARIDPASGYLIHLERTIPADIAAKFNHATFGSVDSGPTQLGDRIFWLPIIVTGDVIENKGKQKGRFTAYYSNYHRYTATSTILPITPTDPNPNL
jgi:hypothetical protein